MPRKDREAKLEYQREWYARPENRKRTIDAVAKRKKEHYTGTCLVCGDTTYGNDTKRIPQYCSKPSCRSVQMRRWWEERPELREEFRERSQGQPPTRVAKTRTLPTQTSLGEIFDALYKDSA